ncbi:hypothetical protein M1M34_gp126 [Haloarcula tailed virus 2]|uniref:Uncharacterized protein n=1 Tax=Haloarcula tailed virus 2 TaxID=2877989 RepID=A0AAE8XYS5_9CAUD|nr:hypothetical protein M1M34_gp126 [Haloarcula tailed virus 2]UBF23207.1 hypothetical protein HATV-2_gp56 [Haloarcula tailed virus 2]
MSKSCWRCDVDVDVTIKHIDEDHHVTEGMLECQHENGGGGTRHWQLGDYCQFCGTKIKT